MKLAKVVLSSIAEAKDDDVIGKTKSGKDVHRAFSHPAHRSFTKQDHEDAVKINRGKISSKLSSREADHYRSNEKMHSMASKEADKKDDKKADSKEDKLSKAFANIDKQFGKK